MTDNERRKRLSELSKIPLFARIDHRLLLDDSGKIGPIANLPRNKRRQLAKSARVLSGKYIAALQKIRNSGAGYPVDRLLRDFAIEYTNRYASSGVNTQPVNFNYIEPFCKISFLKESVAPFAEPAPELDHLFNLTDFFDFLTSKDSDNFKLSSLLELPEGVTLHFTTNGLVTDFGLLNAEDHEFFVSGFSMVRQGNSLHWYILGGEQLSEREWKDLVTEQRDVDLTNTPPEKRLFMEEVISKSGGKFGAPCPLEGTSTALRTIVCGEIDLVSEKVLSRCLMQEMENTFRLYCDDPEIFHEGLETVL